MITDRDNVKCWYVIIFAFVAHLPLITLYPVNFEFTFSEGAKYLINFDQKIVEDYFFNQANTFAYSFIVGLINKIFPIENLLIYTRLLSATSYFFFGLAFINIFKYYKIKFQCYIFLIFFFLNPIIWTYGYRGTPDLLSSSLAIYCFSNIITCNNKFNFKFFFNYFVLGISICVKPFGLIYLGIIILLDYKNNLLQIIKKYLFLIILTLLIPVIYFLLIKFNFNFFLIPLNFQTQVTFIHSNFLYVFFGYSVFLSILVFPLTFNIKYLKKKINLFIMFLLFLLSFFFYNIISTPSAELNFGFFQNLINIKIIAIFAFVLFSFFLIFFIEIIKRKIIINYKLIFIIFFYIFILSLTRPAQRYLITILPIVFLLILINLKLLKKSMLFLVITFIYIPLNLIITINFYFTAHNNQIIISYLRNEQLLSKTDPGKLYPHSYHFFGKDLTKRQYIISDVPGKLILKSFYFNNIINQRYYYINKL